MSTATTMLLPHTATTATELLRLVADPASRSESSRLSSPTTMCTRQERVGSDPRRLWRPCCGQRTGRPRRLPCAMRVLAVSDCIEEESKGCVWRGRGLARRVHCARPRLSRHKYSYGGHPRAACRRKWKASDASRSHSVQCRDG
jgi:hypothetical protein